MPFIESFSEFKQRQDCETFTLPNGSVLFANGATWLVSQFEGAERLASRSEPPVERFELLQRQRLYYQSKLDTEERAFHRAKADYTLQADNALHFPDACPPLPKEALDCLAAGRKRLTALREQLKTIDAELSTSPLNVARAARRERNDALRRERTQMRNAVLAYGGNEPTPDPEPSIRTPTGPDIFDLINPAPPTMMGTRKNS